MYKTSYMKTRIKTAAVVLLMFLTGISLFAQEQELKDGYFYLDGEKFFIKGIGYEQGALPGELPWARPFDADQLRFDMERILDGGFNTIRTWAQFTDAELEVLQEYDIKIIMGIWVDPAGSFASSSFVSSAKSLVSSVLSYSKKYDNIIAYLIMNEPMPEAIFSAGYDETVSLWTQLAEIIHNNHPGRPVSIANTCNGTYIAADVFDFSAYNAYIYNPVTINYLHGYREFVAYLSSLNVPGRPLVITEYGLSVSPTGPGSWGYGGNTLDEQAEGDLHMYKSIVDGGASGSCIFNYSDGWWKGTDEYVHNDLVEEWFGLVNYTSVDDHQGETRPVWDSVRSYQSAIITEPRSGEIYGTKVPLEIFLDDTIKCIDIFLDEQLVWQGFPEVAHFTDTLLIDTVNIKDALLLFKCYDKDDVLVKSEEKSILVSTGTLDLPSVSIAVNADYWDSGKINAEYTLNKGDIFTIGDELYYIYYPHVGFDYGQKYVTSMPAGDPAVFSKTNSLYSSVDAFTIGAGFDISYGSFTKRIVNQLTDKRPAVLIATGKDVASTVSFYPNPATDWFIIENSRTSGLPGFNCAIYTCTGQLVARERGLPWNQPVDISNLAPGVYTLQIESQDSAPPLFEQLIKK